MSCLFYTRPQFPQYKQYIRIYTPKYEVKAAVNECLLQWYLYTYLKEIEEHKSRHTNVVISTAELKAVHR